MVVKLTADNFKSEVAASDKPVLVDFYADWCGPCQMVSPVVDEISEEYPDIKVCKVNVDEEGELSAEFGVMSIPTLIRFDNGEAVETMVGARPKKVILKMMGK